MEKVYISRCKSYEYQQVESAIFKCLDGLQEIKQRLKLNSKVLVKANLLMKKCPGDAVTTHPSVIEAIVRYLQEKGCKVIIGDSPAGPYTKRALMSIYKATGMQEVSDKTGCELNFDIGVNNVVNHKAKMLKNMQIIKVAENVDFIVSVAKMKTHGMMTYSGAVKNLFGVIPGLIKAEYHFKMNNEINFAEHLIDICEYVSPVFSVIDAVEGMEGDGPSAGDKRHAGLIMASSSPYALDTAAAHVMGINPGIIPTIRSARERRIFSGDLKDIDVYGERLEDIKLEPFRLPSSRNVNFVGGRIPVSLEKFVLNTLRPKPVFDHDVCISCGDCKRSCPPGIIAMQGGKPVPDLNKCIRCFCCHEVCPKRAIEIRKHWIHEKLFK